MAPDILLLSNSGAVQLNYGYTVEHCRRAVEMIGADGLILHLNVLQEAVQPEGNRNFKGLTAKIAGICSELGLPVEAEKVINGMSPKVSESLKRAGAKPISVAGRGGTSWYSTEAQGAAKKGKPA